MRDCPDILKALNQVFIQLRAKKDLKLSSYASAADGVEPKLDERTIDVDVGQRQPKNLGHLVSKPRLESILRPRGTGGTEGPR